MDRAEATKILHKMYRVLRDEAIKVSINRKIGIFGDIYYEDERTKIRLNPDRLGKGGIVSTAIHELLHYLDYEAKEYVISKREKEVYKALSDRQLTNLLKRLGPRMRGKTHA